MIGEEREGKIGRKGKKVRRVVRRNGTEGAETK